LLVVFAVALQLGAAVITWHGDAGRGRPCRLAAAAYAVEPIGCVTAGRMSERMMVRLVSCDLQGWQASVRIEATPPGVLALEYGAG
jgi:hypothetical protein